MAQSKAILNDKTENHSRLSVALLNLCTPLYRDLLRYYIPENKFYTEFPKEKNISFVQPFMLKPFFLIPSSGLCKYDELDISVIYSLLRNCGKVPGHVKQWGNPPDPNDNSIAANIERLRIFRNDKYGHLPHASVDDVTFSTLWKEIEDIVKNIEQHVTSGNSNSYQTELKELLSAPIDPLLYSRCVDMLFQLEKISENIQDIGEELQKEIKESTERIAGFQEDISDINRKQVAEGVKEEKGNHWRDRQEKMINDTRLLIEMEMDRLKDVHVDTAALTKVESKLRQDGLVLIKGSPGDGKTTIAMEIMHKLMSKGKRPIQISGYTEWRENIFANANLVIFIDNMFGEFSLSSNDAEQWSQRFQNMKIVTSGHDCNYLIMTMRSDIYEECRQYLTDTSFIQSSMIDISSEENKLTLEEKKSMLKAHLRHCVSETDINALLDGANEILPLGFPQSCRFLKEYIEIQNSDTKDQDSQHTNIESIFNNSLTFLKNYLSSCISRNKAKMAVLIFIALQGGSVSMSVLNNNSEQQTSKQKAMQLCCMPIDQCSIIQFQRSVPIYIGSFLKTSQNVCMFSHSSIYITLLTEIGKYDIESFIANCGHEALNHLRTEKCLTNSAYELRIWEDHFDVLTRRIEHFIKTKDPKAYKAIVYLKIWNDVSYFEFFFRTVDGEFFSSRDKHGNSMMVHFSWVGNKNCLSQVRDKIKDSYQDYLSLNAACEGGHVDCFNYLVSCGVEPDISSCFRAVKFGNISIIKRIQEMGTNLQMVSKSDYRCLDIERNVNILMEAILFEQNHLISPLLKLCPKLLRQVNSQGATALHFACYVLNLKACEIIIQQCKDLICVTDDAGYSPIYWSFSPEKLHRILPGLGYGPYKNNTEVCKLLLRHDNKILYSEGMWDWRLLQRSIMRGVPDVVDLLLPNTNELLNIKDEIGQTALHWSCQESVSTDVFKVVFHKCRQLSYVKDNEGYTPFHIACKEGCLDKIELILQYSKDITQIKDSIGRTPLHEVFSMGNIYVGERLIQFDRTLLKIKDSDGNLPLDFSVVFESTFDDDERLRLCKIILKYDKDAVYERNEDGMSPSYIAYAEDCEEVANLLLQNVIRGKETNDLLINILEYDCEFLQVSDKNGQNILHKLCYNGNTLLCEMIIKHSKELLRLSDNDGKLPLHALCDCTKVSLSTCRLSFLCAKDNTGRTPLHYACCAFNINIEMCKLLIEYDNEVLKVTDNKLKTPLHCVYYRATNAFEICQYIIHQNKELLRFQDKNGLTPIHYACQDGAVDICRLMLQYDKHALNITDNDGKTPLHFASDEEICRLILQHDKELLKIRDFKGRTPLHELSFLPHFKMVMFMINYDKSLLRVADNEGRTPLHIACTVHYNSDIVKLFIQHDKTLVKVKNKYGRSPLHEACMYENLDICELIVKEDRDMLTVRDSDGRTPLHNACKFSTTLCTLLLQYNSTALQVRDKNGLIPLHVASQAGDLDLFMLLFRSNVSLLSIADDAGKTALHHACERGNSGIAMNIMQFDKESIYVRSKNGCTVFHWSCMGGNIRLCKHILKLDESFVNITDNDGYMPLHYASGEVVQWLSKICLNVDAQTNDGKTVLHVASKRGDFKTCIYVLKTYPHLIQIKDCFDYYALHYATLGFQTNHSYNVAIFELFMQNGMNIDCLTNDGKSLLHLFCRQGNLDMYKYIKTKHPDVSVNNDVQGNSLMHETAWGGNIELFNFLLEDNLNPLEVNKNGETVLHLACRSAKFDMSKHLISQYPQLLQIKDNDGRSILHDVAWSGSIELMLFLYICYDVDIYEKSNDGETVLHSACKGGKPKMYATLSTMFPDIVNNDDTRL